MSRTLDLVLGLSFTYALLSIVASALNEVTTALLALRARTLKRGVHTLLDSDLALKVLDHALIAGTAHRSEGASYIPKANFALALVDVLVGPSDAPPDIAELRQAVGKLDPGVRARGALTALLDRTVTDMASARTAIEAWFDAAMTRVAGVYKRVNIVLVVVWALVLSLSLGADSFALARALSRDPGLRQAMVTAAEAGLSVRADAGKPTAAGAPDLATLDRLSEVDLPLGWGPTTVPTTPKGWLVKLAGIVFTAIAVSLGAPFWFDALNRIVNLRASGKPPDRGGGG